MPTKQSAGLLLYRLRNGVPEIFLVHPGGPFWAKKDAGSWTIPKGEFSEEEDPLEAAKREFFEETGTVIDGKFLALKSIKQKSGKIVHCWAVERDIDPSKIKSNTFEIEWPPKSGKRQSFPEVDRGAWFSVAEAKEKILEAQIPFIDELFPGPR